MHLRGSVVCIRWKVGKDLSEVNGNKVERQVLFWAKVLPRLISVIPGKLDIEGTLSAILSLKRRARVCLPDVVYLHCLQVSIGKVELLTYKKSCFVCFNENPLKMMQNAFCFTLKALFVL